MKRALAIVLLGALVLSLPALSQGAPAPDPEAKVSALEKQVEQQAARLAALEAWRKAVEARAKALEAKLRVAKEKGFTLPAPNNDAKEALLGGLQDFARALSGAPAPRKKAGGQE